MSSRKQLKNFNPVSKKSGESHVDPLSTVVNGRFQVTKNRTLRNPIGICGSLMARAHGAAPPSYRLRLRGVNIAVTLTSAKRSNSPNASIDPPPPLLDALGDTELR